MVSTQRGWGFPIGVIAFWMIAVAYTVSALAGMEVTMQSMQPAAIHAS